MCMCVTCRICAEVGFSISHILYSNNLVIVIAVSVCLVFLSDNLLCIYVCVFVPCPSASDVPGAKITADKDSFDRHLAGMIPSCHFESDRQRNDRTSLLCTVKLYHRDSR